MPVENELCPCKQMKTKVDDAVWAALFHAPSQRSGMARHLHGSKLSTEFIFNEPNATVESIQISVKGSSPPFARHQRIDQCGRAVISDTEVGPTPGGSSDPAPTRRAAICN